MEAHIMKLENNYVIVDEEYFNEIKKKAESNQERINEIAEEKFLNYALSEFDKQKHGLEATVKIWKHFALIFIITTIILTIRLFIQL